jgi:hypothetical protein
MFRAGVLGGVDLPQAVGELREEGKAVCSATNQEFWQ